MIEESDTPETDAMASMRRATSEWIELSAKLERERNALRTQIHNNPWCEHCKEKDCEVSLDGECNMIREYLKGKKS